MIIETPSDEKFSQFKETRNVQILKDFIRSEQEFNANVYTNVFVNYLYDMIVEGDEDPSFIEECIIELLISDEENYTPKYLKYIEKIKTADEPEYKQFLFLISHSIFETDNIRKYHSWMIERLLRKHLEDKVYEACKNLIIKEHMQVSMKTNLFINTPDYGDDRSCAYNAGLNYSMLNYHRSAWRNDIIAVFIDFVKKDLEKHPFTFKSNEYQFQNLVINNYNKKDVVKIIGKDNQGETIKVNIFEVSWDFEVKDE